MSLRLTRRKEKDYLLFRRYEKDRRSRFNNLLDKLASLLPNYLESNTAENKWTKAQIVENSIKHFKFLQQQQRRWQNQDHSGTPLDMMTSASNNSDLKLIRLLKKQNRRLRQLLRQKFAPQMTEREFCSLDYNRVKELVNNSAEHPTTTVQDCLSGDDVFVVSTATAQNDHTYSLVVQQEAEIEIETAVIPSEPSQQTHHIIEHDALEMEQHFVSSSSQIILHTVPQHLVVSQPLTVLPAGTFLPLQTQQILPSFGTATTSAPKLPLPRSYSTSSSAAGLVSIYSSPMVASQPWRVPKPKQKKRVYGKPKPPAAAKTKKTNSTVEKPATKPLDPDFVHVEVSSSLPQAILATEDPELSEDERETVDLTSSDHEESSKVGGNKQEEVSKKKQEVLLADCKRGEKIEKDSATKVTKRSKNSYSIAALCQMSVNIGADPAGGGVNTDTFHSSVSSPGMVSLNSAGTASPAGTPVPQSPTPMVNKPTAVTTVGTSSTTSTSSSSAPVTRGQAKKVIQELKPVTEKVVVTAKKQLVDYQPSSPTKSYLTQFPVVKPTNTKNVEQKVQNVEQKVQPSSDYQQQQQQYQTRIKPVEKTTDVLKETLKVAAGKPVGKEARSTVRSDKTPDSHSSNVQQYSTRSKVSPTVSVYHHGKDLSPQQNVMYGTTATPEITSPKRRPVMASLKSPKESSSYTRYPKASIPYGTGSRGQSIVQQNYNSDHHQQRPPAVVAPTSSSSSISQFPSHPFPYPSLPSQPNQVQSTATIPCSLPDYISQSLQPIPPPVSYQMAQTHHHHLSNSLSQSYGNTSHHHHHHHHDFNRQPPTSSSSSGSYFTSRNTNYLSVSSHAKLPSTSYSRGDSSSSSATTSTSFQASSTPKVGQEKQPRNNNNALLLENQSLMQPQQHHSMQHNLVQQQNFHLIDNVDHNNLFSVTQLVKNQHMPAAYTAPTTSSNRRSTKRSAISSSSSGSSSSKKQAKYDTKEQKDKEDKKATKSGSRATSASNRSGGRTSSKRSYTAESLLSNNETMAMVMQQQNSMTADTGTAKQQQQQPRQMVVPKQTTKVPEFNWNEPHFSSSQFQSISPSPANLFPQDLNSLDFSLPMFGPADVPAQMPPVQKYQQQQHKPSKQPLQHQQQHQQQQHQQQQQDFSQQPPEQQYVSQGLFDNTIFPLPTLTPPAGLADDGSSVAYVNFSSSNAAMYGNPAVTSTSSASTLAHRSTSGLFPTNNSYASKGVNLHHQQINHHQQQQQQQQQHQQQQQQQHLIVSNQNMQQPTSSSYVNFNLSTIFPEINLVNSGDKLNVAALLPSAPGPPPLPKLATTSTVTTPSSSIIIASTSAAPIPSLSLPPPPPAAAAEIRPLTTPELLPHGISILGHGSHQVGLSSVPFSGSGFSAGNLNFQLPDQ